MTSIFYGFIQILIFGLEGFPSCVGSTQNDFWKVFTIPSIKKKSYGFWIYSFPIQTFLFCHVTCWNLSSKPSSLPSVKSNIQFQQVSTSFRFYFYLIYPQTFFCNLVWTLGIYKGSTRSFKFLSPSKLPQLVLGTLNLDPSRSTGPQFKFFQNLLTASLDQICHFWWNSFFFFS